MATKNFPISGATSSKTKEWSYTISASDINTWIRDNIPENATIKSAVISCNCSKSATTATGTLEITVGGTQVHFAEKKITVNSYNPNQDIASYINSSNQISGDVVLRFFFYNTGSLTGTPTWTVSSGNIIFTFEEHVHTPGSAATCTTAQTCTACGATITAPLGHDYKAVVTAPTVNSAGYTTHTCSRCGDSYKNDYKYLVSVVASPTEGGTVSGAGTYNQGSTATITATANTGYKFVQWNDGNKNATRTITVSSSTTYTATFEKLTYTISTIVEPDGAGSVQLYRDEPNYDDSYISQYGSATFDYGAKVDLVARDTEGYKFSYWKEDNYNRRLKEITVTGDATFTAVFKKLTQVYAGDLLAPPYSGNAKIAVYVGNTKI